jgi:Fe-S-cluster-containing hydrogenase component 2
MACLRVCPVEAVSGEKKQVHLIDQEKCIRCGMCLSSCRFEAISVH